MLYSYKRYKILFPPIDRLAMSEQCTYGFWFLQHKLDGILTMLERLIDYEMSPGEVQAIRLGLIGTNNEDDKWFEWQFQGASYTLDLELSYDDEESDIICIHINTDDVLREQLELVDTFQSLFKDLELD